jgi:hypothetical protein
MASRLSGTDISFRCPPTSGPWFWKRLLSIFGESTTWRAIAFLLLKFPLGLLSFTLTVTLLSMSVSFLLAPIFYRFSWYDVSVGPWVLDTYGEATAASISGLLLLILITTFRHRLLYCRLAQAMLDA